MFDQEPDPSSEPEKPAGEGRRRCHLTPVDGRGGRIALHHRHVVGPVAAFQAQASVFETKDVVDRAVGAVGHLLADTQREIGPGLVQVGTVGSLLSPLRAQETGHIAFSQHIRTARLTAVLGPDDEARHIPDPDGGGERWGEHWSFEYWAPGAALGCSVRLTLVPGSGVAWFWAALVGPGRPLVAVRDCEVALPRGRSLEVRGPGLWADLVCETPMEHWSVGLEAAAVAYDDPLEAWGGERGDPIPFGLDLEWELDGCEPDQWELEQGQMPGDHEARGYRQFGRVSGGVAVGSQRLVADGWGARSHRWGDHGWGAFPGTAMGRLDDGTIFDAVPVTAPATGAGLPPAGFCRVDGRRLEVTPCGPAPVLVSAGKVSPRGRLFRSLCRFEAEGVVAGAGWWEAMM